MLVKQAYGNEGGFEPGGSIDLNYLSSGEMQQIEGVNR